MTDIVTTVAELRAALAALKPARVGMVPTMGRCMTAMSRW